MIFNFFLKNLNTLEQNIPFLSKNLIMNKNYMVFLFTLHYKAVVFNGGARF